MAGIAFGTAGFIIVQTMGDSVETKMGEHLEILGEATVIHAYWEYTGNFHPGQYFWADVNRLKMIPHLMAVAPVVSLPSIEAHAKSIRWAPRLSGIDQAFWRTQTCYALHGRLIGPTDVVGRKKVCVLGKDVVKYLYEDVNPVGKVMRVANIGFEVIGTLGGVQHTNIRRSIFVPITTAQDLFPGLHRIREIYLRVDDWNEVENVRNRGLQMMEEVHKGYEGGIRMIHYPKRIEKVKSTVSLVKLFIYSALLVTLVLGGLGITNVMLAAVQDRTSEIGLRKALGARQKTILLQFLTESVMIGILAGFVGVVIGTVSVQLLKGALDVAVSTEVMTTSVLIGLAFTAILGIVSGMYPSIRASRLDSVTAMRFE
jgi:putative ABC transport system permease protein